MSDRSSLVGIADCFAARACLSHCRNNITLYIASSIGMLRMRTHIAFP
jgi:hypothetical protein